MHFLICSFIYLKRKKYIIYKLLTNNIYLTTVYSNFYISSYLQTPNTEEWLEIAQQFEERWNFPNCIGALDGKHINIKAPKHSGSLYYKYKAMHSIVLMALADAKIIYMNIVFNRPLPGRTKKIPFVIVADNALAMTLHIIMCTH